jgi:hypothetical protein
MRNKWEGSGADDLDAPATLTERELRALRRRAGFALPAVMLALISIGGLGWTLYSGAEGLDQIQGIKAGILERTAGSESPVTAAVPADAEIADTLGPPSFADSMSAAQATPRDSARATGTRATPH